MKVNSIYIFICLFYSSFLEAHYWNKSISYLKPSLSLEIEGQKKKYIKPSKKILHKRIMSYKSIKEIEPVIILVRNKEDYIEKIARKYFHHSSFGFITHHIKENFNKLPLYKKTESRQLIISSKLLPHSNIENIQKKYQTDHLEVILDTEQFYSDKKKYSKLIQQARPFLSKKRIKQIHRIIKNKSLLKLEKHLLPKFPKRVLTKFTKFRGPNCFHTALAFQNNKFTRSPLYNVKIEKKAPSGYD